jgi:tRNA A-37 threonylcarbamoyl transferase component Bud32
VGADGTKLGNYELLAEIARGSTTDVLLARARGMAGFERHVVIKRVREERAGDSAFTEALINEARLAATLHHHNIVQVQDIAEADGVPYFAMEYVHGEDLRALLAHVHARRESIPIAHVLTIGLAVAAALHQAHEHGIVHRDVTPANIVVGYDGNVKVLDFGMAKAATTPGTQVGIKKGKAPYMAPEQCTGEKIDRRCDVFALGIVLYELVTARRLFKSASDHDTMSTIVHGTIPPPRAHRADLAPELSSIIMKALARLPNDRYQSAADLAQALEMYSAIAGGVGSSSSLGAYLRQQLGERKEPWLEGGSVRATAPVDFDGKEPGIAVPAGETTESTVVAPPPADDEMVEETATMEIAADQLAAEVEELTLPPRSATATDVDLPLAPPVKPKPDAAPARKPIPSLTGKAAGKLDPAAFISKGAVAAPAPKATAFAAAAPSAAVAKKIDAKPVPAPPVIAKPEVAAAGSPQAEKPNWDGQSTNVPRLPPPPRVAPRISTPNAMPKLEAAAAALDGKLGGAQLDPKPEAAAKRARRGSTAPITSDTSGQARGEIVVETPQGGVVAQRAAADMTELVVPLPHAGRTSTEPARASKHHRVLLAAVGGAALFLVIVLAIAFSGGSSSASSSGASPNVTEPAKPAMPAPSAAAAAEPAAAPATGEMTYNGMLDAGAAADKPAATIDAAEVAVPEVAAPEVAAPEPKAPPAEPARDEPLPPARRPIKPMPRPIARPIARPPAKPKSATKPTKPAKAAPLKYDPNTLFLPK